MGNTNKEWDLETQIQCSKIAQRIKSRREELNMSQDELAKKIGYKGRSAINKIEQNVNNLRQDKIKLMADALNVSPAWLMCWDEETDTKAEIDPNLANEDAELLTIFHQLSANDKKRLIEMAKLLLQ